MTKRTVTEKQVRSAFIDHLLPNQIVCFNHLMDELFPELPKFNELILVWDGDSKEGNTWRPFHYFTNEGRAIVSYLDGSLCEWDHYRRQTPAERGQG